MTTTWIDAYFRRASELSRMTPYDRAYTAIWNALEDDVLARSYDQQHALWARACETKNFDAAMVICAMLPLDLTAPDAITDAY